MSAAVASDPVITSLNQTSSSSVRVEWSQPSGGATVTGYVVHYSDGDTDRNESVHASSTSSLITGLTINITYYFSVEATSEHLSGESEVLDFNVTFTPQPTVAFTTQPTVTFTTQPTVTFTTQPTVTFTTQPTEMTTTSGSVYFNYSSCYKALFTLGSRSSDDAIVIIVGVLSILTLMIIVSIFIVICCLFQK